jgi:hypothetical protein
MQTWEKKKKVARDLVLARPELGTDGGEPSVVRRAVASRARIQRIVLAAPGSEPVADSVTAGCCTCDSGRASCCWPGG